jgi:hypothetical protein
MRIVIVLALCSACISQEKSLGTTEPDPDPAPAKVIGNTRWALTFGTWDEEAGVSIAMDSNDNVIAAGFCKSGTDFGSGQILITAPPPVSAAWVSKRSAGDGGELWTHVFDPGLDAVVEIAAIATDANDNVYVCGVVGGVSGPGAIDFGGQSLTATADAFVGKWNGSGVLQWVRGLGANSRAQCSDLAIGQDDHVYMVGSYAGVLELPDGPVTGPGDYDFDAYIAAFDSSGTLLWGRTFVETSARLYSGPGAGGVAISPGGDVIMYGVVTGSATFGGEPLVAPDTGAPYVARFSASGELRLRHLLASTESSMVRAIMRPDDTAIVLSSHNEGVPRPVLEAFDANGANLWVQDSDYRGGLTAMTTTAEGTTVVAGDGWIGEQADGNLSLFLAAHDGEGVRTDLRIFEQPPDWYRPDVEFRDIASKHGTLALIGTAGTRFDFGTGTQRWDGRGDIVIVLLDAPADVQ